MLVYVNESISRIKCTLKVFGSSLLSPKPSLQHDAVAMTELAIHEQCLRVYLPKPNRASITATLMLLPVTTHISTNTETLIWLPSLRTTRSFQTSKAKFWRGLSTELCGKHLVGQSLPSHSSLRKRCSSTRKSTKSHLNP